MTQDADKITADLKILSMAVAEATAGKREPADFYVGRGPAAEYLGSAAFMGSPSLIGTFNGAGGLWSIFQSRDEEEFTVTDFREAVSDMVEHTSWPHVHDDSTGTEWAYAYDTGTVYVYHLGVEMAQIRCNHRRWVRRDLVETGGNPDQQEFVPRRTARFPSFPAHTNTEG